MRKLNGNTSPDNVNFAPEKELLDVLDHYCLRKRLYRKQVIETALRRFLAAEAMENGDTAALKQLYGIKEE